MNIESLQKWFKEHVTINDKPYILDDEQASVVLDVHENTIVTARAGSGKTHTLIAKIIYLIVIKGVNPEHILALGFNAEPQADFRNRLTHVKVDGKQVITDKMSNQLARTFHSFASDMAKLSYGEILFDDPKKQEKKARTEYINAIVEKIVDGKAIYDFIRNDSYEPKEEDYKTPDEYYLAKKYQKYETLNGETVKSRGEKIIADYLFEHGIDYDYEREYYPKTLYKYAANKANTEDFEKHDKIICDFYLSDYDLVWEHWGITGDETQDEIDKINESGVIGNYEEYKTKKGFKKFFYAKEWLSDNFDELQNGVQNDLCLKSFLKIKGLVETNYAPGISREDFETVIENTLHSFNIYPQKLSEDVLLQKFQRTINIKNTSRRVATFINRAEQQFPNNFSELQEACKKEEETQTKLFYKVSLAAYHYYLSEIKSDPSQYGSRGLIDELYFPKTIYADDYNLLMARAAENIAKRTERQTSTIKIDSLEYIFLDEYQDFSLLFFNLISAIKERVPSIHILAVGDDWQAINGYAGASLDFFNNFEEYFPGDTARLSISTNYRSVFSIVDAANKFMLNSLKDDKKAVAFNNDICEDSLNECPLDSIKKFYKDEDHEYPHDYRRRYDLLLSAIVKDNPGKTIKFLNRTRDLHFEKGDSSKLPQYKNDFIELCKTKCHINNTDSLSFSTVNTAKGLESDIVVLLETDIGRFPIFHPDNHLYKVFGENEQKALDDQKRLFYVAITRAKEKLYIIHKTSLPEDNTFNDELCDAEDAQQQSNDRDFLAMLEANTFHKYQKNEFLSLQKQIENETKKSFLAKKIEFSKNRYNPKNFDIIVTSLSNEKVIHRNAIPDYRSTKEMRELMNTCSKEKPVRIWTKVKRYPNGVYINLYKSQFQYSQAA